MRILMWKHKLVIMNFKKSILMVAQFQLPNFFILSLFLLISTFIYSSDVSLPTFEQYLILFNKNYDNAEYPQRQQIYNQNLKYIKKSNCSSVGVNNFTDWSSQEMKRLKGGYQVTLPIQSIAQLQTLKGSGLNLTEKTTPNQFDWRDQKAVTSVKNQLSCGACWSFSTIAFYESDLIINQNYSNQIDLSEQFLLKCDNRSLMCDGGFLFWAMQKVIERGGIPRESQYPYNYGNLWENNGMCYEKDIIRIDPNTRMVSFYEVEDINFVEKMLLKKPINVNLCSRDLQFYAPNFGSRILSCSSGQTSRDHTVLLVGYTETEWIIKNQWSTNWGVEGYGYISKQPDNDCCIGKQLFTTGTISKQCKVSNCQICVEETSCFKCNQGFYVRNVGGSHTCQLCFSPNCAKCVNFYGLCDTCIQGYSVSYPTYRCEKATVQKCSFIYNNLCLECHQGYVLNNNGKCIKETNPCYSYKCSQCQPNSNNLCQICSNGYSLNTATFQCEPIPECSIANCSRCALDNKNWCEVCKNVNNMFSQATLECVPICEIEGCAACMVSDYNKTVCSKCMNGYRLKTDDRTCEKCAVKYCSNCEENPVLSCESCLTGYFFDSLQIKCLPCQLMDFCIECFKNQQNGFNCTKCASGYTLSSDGLTCLKCLGECPLCDKDSLATCSGGCGLLNYMSSTGSCGICQENCLECEDDKVCTKCFEGFRLNNGWCISDCGDIPGCATCDATPSGSVCTRCQEGHNLENNVCVIDISYSCLEENGKNPSNCTSCPQNYYVGFSIQRRMCARCSTNDSNCMSCSALLPDSCLKCVNSFYLSSTTSTCTKCSDFDENCFTCLGPNQCTKCKTGFYLLSIQPNDQQSGLCQSCNPSCLTCKFNSQYCLSCREGYSLSTNRRCLRMMGVKFTIVLDASYQNDLNRLQVELYQILKQMLGMDSRRYIEIISISEGSIEIVGNLHMPDNQTDEHSFLEKIKSILVNQSIIASYNVLFVKAELIVRSDAPKLTQIDQFSTGTLIGVSVGAGVFFICLVILIVIGVRKFVLANQENTKGKEKQKSGISTDPSSEKKSKSEGKGKNGKDLDETEKYIKDEIVNVDNLGYSNGKSKV